MLSFKICVHDFAFALIGFQYDRDLRYGQNKGNTAHGEGLLGSNPYSSQRPGEREREPEQKPLMSRQALNPLARSEMPREWAREKERAYQGIYDREV